MKGSWNCTLDTFIHEEKDVGGEGISLSNAFGWGEGGRGRAIDKNGEKSFGDKSQGIVNLSFFKPEGSESVENILLAKFTKGFGYTPFD